MKNPAFSGGVLFIYIYILMRNDCTLNTTCARVKQVSKIRYVSLIKLRVNKKLVYCLAFGDTFASRHPMPHSELTCGAKVRI